MRQLQAKRRFVAFLLGCIAALCACPGARPYPRNDGAGSCTPLKGCTGTHCCAADQLCKSVVCEGREYVCTLSSSKFEWLPASGTKVPCDDGDPCTTNDLCVSGSCLGVKMACKEPPASQCLDSKTLRSYGSQGSCNGGNCEYPPVDTPCPQGCQNAQCTGNPCLGVKCDKPPSNCYSNPGTCTDGKCSYQPLPVGSNCSTGNTCESGGTCDSQGICKATGMNCSAPNATGNCVNGACQYACSSGWGNCNGAWNDGCEINLTTNSNCGSCGKSCNGAPHATGSCSGTSCQLTCTAPYKDCDGNAGNGCEIPVGVANSCDKSGLGSGCGTAYCGSSGTAGAANFGSWTCVFCVQCHHYSNGWSWCLFNPGSGQFSSDRCTSCCNSDYEDKVCPK